MNKICNSCQVQKDLSYFPKKKKGLYGVCSQCKNCRNAYHAVWYHENRFIISRKNQKKYAAKTQARISLLTQKG